MARLSASALSTRRVGPGGERGEAGEACGREGDDGVQWLTRDRVLGGATSAVFTQGSPSLVRRGKRRQVMATRLGRELARNGSTVHA